MENPWLGLPEKPPYILPGDHGAIKELNDNLDAKNKRTSRIHDEILPEPYVGNPFTASVVLLNLNPGFEESDCKWHGKSAFGQAALNNLHHRKRAFPFYLLDPQFKDSGGAKYWRKRLQSLIEKRDAKVVAKAICVIEWHPYHSEKSSGHPAKPFCKSQDYTAWLVRQAITRDGCVVLLLRSRTRWKSLVPETSDCPIVNSPQSAYLTENNTSRTPGLWKRIEAAVCSHVHGAQK